MVNNQDGSVCLRARKNMSGHAKKASGILDNTMGSPKVAASTRGTKAVLGATNRPSYGNCHEKPTKPSFGIRHQFDVITASQASRSTVVSLVDFTLYKL